MKFSRTLWVATAACLWAPHVAFAAKAAPLATMPGTSSAYTWSGAYFGGQLGYGSAQSSASGISLFHYPDGTFTATLPGFDLGSKGLIGGVEAGYGWQADGLYFGVEADASAAGIKGTYTDSVDAYSLDSTLQWLSTARVRVGLPMDRFLLFASGGLAVGGIRADLHDSYAGPGVINSSSSSTGWGWTVGAGVAAALSDHWTVKAEYLYADLGSQQYTFVEPTGPEWSKITNSARTTASIGRVAIDYRF